MSIIAFIRAAGFCGVCSMTASIAAVARASASLEPCEVAALCVGDGDTPTAPACATVDFVGFIRLGCGIWSSICVVVYNSFALVNTAYYTIFLFISLHAISLNIETTDSYD